MKTATQNGKSYWNLGEECMRREDPALLEFIINHNEVFFGKEKAEGWTPFKSTGHANASGVTNADLTNG